MDGALMAQIAASIGIPGAIAIFMVYSGAQREKAMMRELGRIGQELAKQTILLTVILERRDLHAVMEDSRRGRQDPVIMDAEIPSLTVDKE